MKTKASITELKRLTPSELRKELYVKRMEAAKMRLGIKIQKEKDHATYRAHRRDIARMCMVLAQMSVSAPAAPKEAKKASQETVKPVKDTAPKRVTSSRSKPKARG